jgi:hypothetical protein
VFLLAQLVDDKIESSSPLHNNVYYGKCRVSLGWIYLPKFSWVLVQ